MAFLVGTDEAGYGPNLGPLVVAATLWEVPDVCVDADLYELLGDCIVKDGSAVVGNGSRDVPKWWVADSKDVYKPGKGRADLELHTLTGLRLAGHLTRHWQELWRCLDDGAMEQMQQLPWFDGFERPLPMQAAAARIDEASEAIGRSFNAHEVRLCGVKARAVFPPKFNAHIEELGNKATVLSHTTLELVRSLVEPLGDHPILIHCDKHGGRNKYAGLLQHFFPDEFVRVIEEGRQQSAYTWGVHPRAVRIRFVAKGEDFLPSALASMTAKLLREMSMEAFNVFWQGHVPQLRPTAGYPVDAKRFKEEIATVQRRLGIADSTLWRTR